MLRILHPILQFDKYFQPNFIDMIFYTLDIFYLYLQHINSYNLYNMHERKVKLVKVFYLNILHIFCLHMIFVFMITMFIGVNNFKEGFLFNIVKIMLRLLYNCEFFYGWNFINCFFMEMRNDLNVLNFIFSIRKVINYLCADYFIIWQIDLLKTPISIFHYYST